MVENLLKAIALIGFALFCAVLAWRVPSLDLIIVLVVVVGMATYDFFIRPAMRRWSR